MLLDLKKDDVLDIIFPATSCSLGQVQDIKSYVKNYLNLAPRIHFEEEFLFLKQEARNEFANISKKLRFLQLKQALESEDSKIIWSARGGYGSGDLLPFLQKINKPKINKIFLGFSDITSISSYLLNKWSYKSIYYANLLELANGKVSHNSQDELKELIFKKKQQFSYNLKLLNKVDNNIEAEICGGCLSVLCGHFGGAYQINFHNKILFLEDEGEDGERLDRYFRQIIEVILTKKVIPKAILLGSFLQNNLHGKPKAENINIAIQKFLKSLDDFNLKIPIFQAKDDDLGHGKNMRLLTFGTKSKISIKDSLLTTSFF